MRLLDPVRRAMVVVGLAVTASTLAIAGATSSGIAQGNAKEPASATAAPGSPESLDSLIADHPGEAERIRELDADMAASKRLARDLVHYQGLLESHPGLRQHEIALLDALENDPALEKLLLDFEFETTGDPGATEEVAHLDVLIAADSVFADRMREIELVTAADDTVLARFLDALTFFEASPDRAEPVFAEPGGPSEVDVDRVLRQYTRHLARHPEIYRPWWELYAHLRQAPPFCRQVYDHWYWFQPRPRLRRQWWRFRLTVASQPELHARLWERRLYLGADPGLAEQIWQHRLSMARNRLLRRYARYILRQPEIAAAVVARHRMGG